MLSDDLIAEALTAELPEDFDHEAATHGRWFPFEGGELRIAYGLRPSFVSELVVSMSLCHAAQQEIEAGGNSLEARSRLISAAEALYRKHLQLTARKILLDWRGFTDPYSIELAVELLRTSPAIIKKIQTVSLDVSNFLTPRPGDDGPAS